jgi:leader peptidase (prepilin peptidase)/N-methyltransferase
MFDHSLIFLLTSALLGLIAGSFFNVVVYRLPLILQKDWRNECCELLGLTTETAAPKTFNLFLPRSHCPQCQHQLSWRENIPVLSFLLLKGKCAYCNQAIAWRYPLLEIASMMVMVIVAAHYGLSWQCAVALSFSWSLLVLTVIDLEHQLLPDVITLPLLWFGLLISIPTFFVDSTAAILGVVIGYLILWVVAWLFHRVTKKVGMGHGDFKLLALLGAWLGWQLLPFVLLFAALLGSVVGLTLIALKKQTRDAPIPFGPFLAFAGWIALLWGNQIYSFWELH